MSRKHLMNNQILRFDWFQFGYSYFKNKTVSLLRLISINYHCNTFLRKWSIFVILFKEIPGTLYPSKPEIIPFPRRVAPTQRILRCLAAPFQKTGTIWDNDRAGRPRSRRSTQSITAMATDDQQDSQNSTNDVLRNQLIIFTMIFLKYACTKCKR